MAGITDKEMEALLFVMDDDEMVMTALGQTYGDKRVRDALARMRPQIERRMMPEFEDDLDRAILRFAIEDSDWPGNYIKFNPDEIEQARRVMRQLAVYAESVGVEVDRIAFD